MSSRRRSFSSSSEDSSDVSEKESNNKCTNVFRNDGSFLEMFKKMQKSSQLGSTSSTNTHDQKVSGKISENSTEKEVMLKEDPKPSKPVPIVGRRKCNKALPVGKVKKLKAGEEQEKKPPTTDAWAKYLEEVKKYKETYCDSESKNRSLVK